jgi:hypothetical protein
VRSRIETETDFREAITLENARRCGEHLPRSPYQPQVLYYSEHVRYVDQLRRYEAQFPREQILVLIYEDYLSNNIQTVRRALRFLDVDDTVPIEVGKVNKTVSVRSPRMNQLLHAASVGRGPISQAVKSVVKPITSRKLRHNALGVINRRVVYGEAPPPDNGLMLELRRRFRPEVVALSEYLDRDLVALWGYDSIS